jgi:teichuronic acid biosynthesis glycosyltransferase TuaC
MNRRMKITAVTSYFPLRDGSFRGHSALHTLRRLQTLADVDVICCLTRYPKFAGKSERPDPAYRPFGLNVTYVEYPGIPLLTRPVNGAVCARYVYPHLQRSKPDVVLNYWIYPDGFAALRCGRTLGIPVIVGSIGSDLRRIPEMVTRRLVRSTVRGADGVITVSEDLRRLAIGLGAEAEKVVTISNGCDTSVFCPGKRDASDDEIVLYVGAFLEAKGLGELVEAFGAVARRRPRARLVMIGDGPFRGEIVRRAVAAGISDRIQFTGVQPSTVVGDWMRAAGVFCLPSYSEGCPNVVVEALACGTPVVATDVGGIPELVDTECGILVGPRRPEDLREALDRALSRGWDRAGIAAAHRRSWDAVARETCDVCCRAVEAARR